MSQRNVTRPATIRLLLVDAHRDEVEMYRIGLEQLGVEVEACESVEEAILCLDRWRFDAVVSDADVPSHASAELIRQLRSREAEYARIPAMALSSGVRDDDAQVALDTGFDVSCAKPCTPAALAELALRLVSRSDEHSARATASGRSAEGAAGSTRATTGDVGASEIVRAAPHGDRERLAGRRRELEPLRERLRARQLGSVIDRRDDETPEV